MHSISTFYLCTFLSPWISSLYICLFLHFPAVTFLFTHLIANCLYLLISFVFLPFTRGFEKCSVSTVYVLIMWPWFEWGTYLLKDIRQLAQNILLQAVECGDAAGRRRASAFRQKTKLIHTYIISCHLLFLTENTIMPPLTISNVSFLYIIYVFLLFLILCCVGANASPVFHNPLPFSLSNQWRQTAANRIVFFSVYCCQVLGELLGLCTTTEGAVHWLTSAPCEK